MSDLSADVRRWIAVCGLDGMAGKRELFAADACGLKSVPGAAIAATPGKTS